MIDSIISGKVYGKPEQRTSGKGTAFVRLKIRIPTQDGSAMFASAVCFSQTMGQQLLALDDGDSVSLAGSITIKPWLNSSGEPCAGLDMVVHGVLTAYHVKRKREAMETSNPGNRTAPVSMSQNATSPAFLDLQEDAI